uniref:NADH dehydrogenase subunit 6 n=1 Tax=Scrobicularia plana TaxID=665965 RepID=A0A6H2U288_9BIVA|nr:NADH dehydrogenase subunit 6 [Scrobicularia plana]
MFGLGLWVVSGVMSGIKSSGHPVLACGYVLVSYFISCCALWLECGLISGCLLFLAGAGGVLVTFLFVVALCPSSVLKVGTESLSGMGWFTGFLIVGFLLEFFGVKSWVGPWPPMSDVSLGMSWAGILIFFGVLLLVVVVAVVNMCRFSYGCVSSVKVVGSKKSARRPLR